MKRQEMRQTYHGWWASTVPGTEALSCAVNNNQSQHTQPGVPCPVDETQVELLTSDDERHRRGELAQVVACDEFVAAGVLGGHVVHVQGGGEVLLLLRVADLVAVSRLQRHLVVAPRHL